MYGFLKLQTVFSVLFFTGLNSHSYWWYKILLVSTNSEATNTHDYMKTEYGFPLTADVTEMNIKKGNIADL